MSGIKYVTLENLERYTTWLNLRLNNLATKGLHSCAGCGAPYKGLPTCEYCGRGFFVDMIMFKEKQNERTK